jgi:uncharacterized protein YeaO (DUF488 family)
MSPMPPRIAIKRAYEPLADGDGCWILVDRIWPRGLSTPDLRLDAWVKGVAPSTELREWFGHDPVEWTAFGKRYFAELDARPEAVEELLAACGARALTLVFAAKDADHSNATALREYLRGRLAEGKS